MQKSSVTDTRPEPTDPLYDVSSEGLAKVFGRRALEMMRGGRDPYEAARLAFTFAARVVGEREATAALIDGVAELQASGRCGAVSFGVTH